MLRHIDGVSWNSHTTNKELYGSLLPISQIIQPRRLKFAGYLVRSEEPASRLFFWNPNGRRRVGRPSSTLSKIIQDGTGLNETLLTTATQKESTDEEILFWSHPQVDDYK